MTAPRKLSIKMSSFMYLIPSFVIVLLFLLRLTVPRLPPTSELLAKYFANPVNVLTANNPEALLVIYY